MYADLEANVGLIELMPKVKINSNWILNWIFNFISFSVRCITCASTEERSRLFVAKVPRSIKNSWSATIRRRSSARVRPDSTPQTRTWSARVAPGRCDSRRINRAEMAGRINEKSRERNKRFSNIAFYSLFNIVTILLFDYLPHCCPNTTHSFCIVQVY